MPAMVALAASFFAEYRVQTYVATKSPIMAVQTSKKTQLADAYFVQRVAHVAGSFCVRKLYSRKPAASRLTAVVRGPKVAT
jgi:hypothetical protein